MLKVGITGGIGSGKTVVAKIIESLGYPVFYSDQVAKDFMNNNLTVRTELNRIVGEDLYSKGQLDRAKLADHVFNNETIRSAVNQLVHPLVRKAFEDFCSNSRKTVVFNEAAILFETGAYKNFDKNVLVVAPEAVKIKRVMKRDGTTEEEVRSRMASQWPDDKKTELADFIIDNSESKPLLEQVEALIVSLKAIN